MFVEVEMLPEFLLFNGSVKLTNWLHFNQVTDVHFKMQLCSTES